MQPLWLILKQFYIFLPWRYNWEWYKWRWRCKAKKCEWFPFFVVSSIFLLSYAQVISEEGASLKMLLFFVQSSSSFWFTAEWHCVEANMSAMCSRAQTSGPGLVYLICSPAEGSPCICIAPTIAVWAITSGRYARTCIAGHCELYTVSIVRCILLQFEQ